MLALSPLIKPIPGLAIWTLVSFGLTYWVLKRYAFGPIQRVIDASASGSRSTRPTRLATRRAS
jgi:hypothetical protein